MLKSAHPDQCEVVPGHLVALPSAQIGLELESNKNISQHAQPREKRRLLKHDQPFATGSRHAFTIGEQSAVVGFLQAGSDIEQGCFPATARADKTHKFTLGNVEAYPVQRQNMARSAS
nr:hypothetical protein [Candidatus Methylacidithermus pantelleriae]